MARVLELAESVLVQQRRVVLFAEGVEELFAARGEVARVNLERARHGAGISNLGRLLLRRVFFVVSFVLFVVLFVRFARFALFALFALVFFVVSFVLFVVLFVALEAPSAPMTWTCSPSVR